MQKYKKMLLIAVTAVFIVGQFLWAYMFYLTGPFILVMILLSLKEYSFKKVGLILSTLSGYPLAWLVEEYLNVGKWSVVILSGFIVLIFIGIYVYLLRNLWTWLDPVLVRTMIISLLFLSAFAIFYSYQVVPCYYVSGAEKGVSVSAVQWCKIIGMYNENALINSKTGFLIAILFVVHSVLVYLPVLTSVVVLFASLLMNRGKSLGTHRKN